MKGQLTSGSPMMYFSSFSHIPCMVLSLFSKKKKKYSKPINRRILFSYPLSLHWPTSISYIVIQQIYIGHQLFKKHLARSLKDLVLNQMFTLPLKGTQFNKDNETWALLTIIQGRKQETL